MNREWKPGDVALVIRLGKPEIAIRRHPDGGTFGWFTAYGDADYDDARPLVVIDPEDREQVERLARINHAEMGGLPDEFDGDLLEAMTLALREFGAQKPGEPMGVGAVVEDANGDLWVRFERVAMGNMHWRHVGFNNVGKWQAVNAVRVLSEGVTA